jgi:hypothetical protein
VPRFTCKLCNQSTNLCSCCPRRLCSCGIHVDSCQLHYDDEASDLSLNTGIFANAGVESYTRRLRWEGVTGDVPRIPDPADVAADRDRQRWNRLLAATQSRVEGNPWIRFEGQNIFLPALEWAINRWREIDRVLAVARREPTPDVRLEAVVPTAASPAFQYRIDCGCGSQFMIDVTQVGTQRLFCMRCGQGFQVVATLPPPPIAAPPPPKPSQVPEVAQEDRRFKLLELDETVAKPNDEPEEPNRFRLLELD